MVVLIVYHIFRDGVSPLWALGGFIPGLAIGFVLTRTKVLSWEPSEQVVVGTTDAVGIVILVVYILFILFRDRIIGSEVHDAAAVSLIGLALTAGAMLGRIYFTLRGIRNILVAADLDVAGQRPS